MGPLHLSLHRPSEVFRYRGRACERWTAREGWQPVATDLPPLEHLGRMLRRHPPVDVPGLPRFIGGAVGYLGYDIVRTSSPCPTRRRTIATCPMP